MINESLKINMLKDALGREISYLRVSLTERCNFRCHYCYEPAKNRTNRHERLSNEELITLLKAFSRLGIDKIRLTGGEPLLRRGIVGIVRSVSRINGNHLVGLTTNGYLLAPLLDDLIDAGMNRLNVSLDSLNRENFKRITGFDGLDRVLDAINEAQRCKVFPWVKVNTVVMRGVNDTELKDLAHWALERRIDLRFIEYMPTKKADWGEGRFITENRIRELVGLDLEPDFNIADISGPATRYKVEGYPGRLSFISAISHGFCKACNRLRLTSNGDLIGCLYGENRVPLVYLLTEKNSIEEIAAVIRSTVVGEEFRRIPEKKGESYKPAMISVGG